jgi:diguanylate cyclase
MPAESNDVSGQDTSSGLRTNAQRTLPRRTYRLRILGMGLASLPLMAVMHELRAAWPAWTLMALTCFAWPHLAYALARRSKDPFLAELRNLVVDSAIAGSWVPVMHFNLLPSAVLLSVVSADKISVGVRGLLLRSLPASLVALLGVGLLTGFAFQPLTSMTVIASCLPIMIIHTLAVSATSYRLVRRVQAQNLRLEALSRMDTLTGLYARGHWEILAQAALRDSGPGSAATMLVLDIDRFKEINDRYGHGVGDDVLRGIADLVWRNMPVGSHAGRLGGDEFAIVVPYPLHEAESAAEGIRAAVHGLEFPNAPGLRCTISAGIASAPGTGTDLRGWIESADRALYRAKQAGRNRAVSADPVAAS